MRMRADPPEIIDVHAHLVGLGDALTGAYVDPHWLSWRHPLEHLRFKIWSKGSGVDDLKRADRQYVDRLVQLAQTRPWKGKLWLLALDEVVDAQGQARPEQTHFHMPTEAVAGVVQRHPHLFGLACSVHPYRPDALERLERTAALGARLVKWLPNAMGFHPGEERLRPYYEAMRRLGLTLLCHTGHEMAVPSPDAQFFGNPLHLRLPLGLGVRVIAAHGASLGVGEDFERGGKAPNVDLLFRLMEAKEYESLLYGDLSALTLFSRLRWVRHLLSRRDLLGRFIHGSDYPLPGVDIAVWLLPYRWWGLLGGDECAELRKLYRENPLVFDGRMKLWLKDPLSGEPLVPDACFRTPDFLA